MRFRCAIFVLIAIGNLNASCPAADSANVESIVAEPTEVQIDGRWNRTSLLITGRRSDGTTIDLTDQATYRIETSSVAQVSSIGVVRPQADGRDQITVSFHGKSIVVPVTVTGYSSQRQFDFDNDIEPLLSKFGCNASTCHGKAEGQNGFKLSVFSSEPLEDFQRLTREDRGRRVFSASPQNSLLLQKASGTLPHGGGARIPATSVEYQTLHEWIVNGVQFGNRETPHVVSIHVSPTERLLAMKGHQRLRVVASFSDGSDVDVTHLSRFQSNNDAVCTVDQTGLCTTGDTPGDVVVMAAYMGFVDVFRGLIPRAADSASTEDFEKSPQLNFIDELVDRKLSKLNLGASKLADDADFLRRVTIDTIGTLPTSDETRMFLSDQRADRRQQWVNTLIERPEFADYWALQFADILRVDRRTIGHQGAYTYYRWIRDSLASNKPYDQFARELMSAEGPLNEAPAGYFYKAVPEPGQMAASLCQTLLGVRIECAQCHHHPFDRWSQSDYYGMQDFFSQLSFKKGASSEILFARATGETTHPRTGERVIAHALGESVPDQPYNGDRRKILADWVTSPANPWFAKNLVNRVWAHYLGRGLIDPVDDVRVTNPPSNPELLDAISKNFLAHHYDIRDLIRLITSSRTYQLSTQPNHSNERDEQNFSRALFKRLPSEVLSDAISQITGIEEKFPGVPAGTRAIQLWDNEVPHYFLKTFGRPERTTPCTCERSVEPNVAQVLHILNSPEIQAKLSHEGGRTAKLVRRLPEDAAVVEELYLTVFSRYPTARERKIGVEYFREHASDRRKSAEDLTWSLMNTSEFLFNH